MPKQTNKAIGNVTLDAALASVSDCRKLLKALGIDASPATVKGVLELLHRQNLANLKRQHHRAVVDSQYKAEQLAYVLQIACGNLQSDTSTGTGARALQHQDSALVAKKVQDKESESDSSDESDEEAETTDDDEEAEEDEEEEEEAEEDDDEEEDSDSDDVPLTKKKGRARASAATSAPSSPTSSSAASSQKSATGRSSNIVVLHRNMERVVLQSELAQAYVTRHYGNKPVPNSCHGECLTTETPFNCVADMTRARGPAHAQEVDVGLWLLEHQLCRDNARCPKHSDTKFGNTSVINMAGKKKDGPPVCYANKGATYAFPDGEHVVVRQRKGRKRQCQATIQLLAPFDGPKNRMTVQQKFDYWTCFCNSIGNPYAKNNFKLSKDVVAEERKRMLYTLAKFSLTLLRQPLDDSVVVLVVDEMFDHGASTARPGVAGLADRDLKAFLHVVGLNAENRVVVSRLLPLPNRRRETFVAFLSIWLRDGKKRVVFTDCCRGYWRLTNYFPNLVHGKCNHDQLWTTAEGITTNACEGMHHVVRGNEAQHVQAGARTTPTAVMSKLAMSVFSNVPARGKQLGYTCQTPDLKLIRFIEAARDHYPAHNQAYDADTFLEECDTTIEQLTDMLMPELAKSDRGFDYADIYAEIQGDDKKKVKLRPADVIKALDDIGWDSMRSRREATAAAAAAAPKNSASRKSKNNAPKSLARRLLNGDMGSDDSDEEAHKANKKNSGVIEAKVGCRGLVADFLVDASRRVFNIRPIMTGRQRRVDEREAIRLLIQDRATRGEIVCNEFDNPQCTYMCTTIGFDANLTRTVCITKTPLIETVVRTDETVAADLRTAREKVTEVSGRLRLRDSRDQLLSKYFPILEHPATFEAAEAPADDAIRQDPVAIKGILSTPFSTNSVGITLTGGLLPFEPKLGDKNPKDKNFVVKKNAWTSVISNHGKTIANDVVALDAFVSTVRQLFQNRYNDRRVLILGLAEFRQLIVTSKKFAADNPRLVMPHQQSDVAGLMEFDVTESRTIVAFYFSVDLGKVFLADATTKPPPRTDSFDPLREKYDPSRDTFNTKRIDAVKQLQSILRDFGIIAATRKIDVAYVKVPYVNLGSHIDAVNNLHLLLFGSRGKLSPALLEAWLGKMKSLALTDYCKYLRAVFPTPNYPWMPLHESSYLRSLRAEERLDTAEAVCNASAVALQAEQAPKTTRTVNKISEGRDLLRKFTLANQVPPGVIRHPNVPVAIFRNYINSCYIAAAVSFLYFCPWFVDFVAGIESESRTGVYAKRVREVYESKGAQSLYDAKDRLRSVDEATDDTLELLQQLQCDFGIMSSSEARNSSISWEPQYRNHFALDLSGEGVRRNTFLNSSDQKDSGEFLTSLLNRLFMRKSSTDTRVETPFDYVVQRRQKTFDAKGNEVERCPRAECSTHPENVVTKISPDLRTMVCIDANAEQSVQKAINATLNETFVHAAGFPLYWPCCGVKVVKGTDGKPTKEVLSDGEFQKRGCFKSTIIHEHNIIVPPLALLVYVARFGKDQTGDYIKNQRIVELSDTVELPVTDLDATRRVVRYKLAGYTVHRGNSINGGHWRSFVRVPVAVTESSPNRSEERHQWHEVDDMTSVRQLPINANPPRLDCATERSQREKEERASGNGNADMVMYLPAENADVKLVQELRRHHNMDNDQVVIDVDMAATATPAHPAATSGHDGLTQTYDSAASQSAVQSQTSWLGKVRSGVSKVGTFVTGLFSRGKQQPSAATANKDAALATSAATAASAAAAASAVSAVSAVSQASQVDAAPAASATASATRRKRGELPVSRQLALGNRGKK